MLFAVLYTARDVTEEKEKRSLSLFTNWKPPAGYEFKAHYSLADGTGGVAIVEANSPVALLEAHAPWGPFFEFRTVPVVEVDQAIPIFQKVNAWRDSVK
jgi:hypothetical protein